MNEPLMPSDMYVRKLREEQDTREALAAAVGESVKVWEPKLAYFNGAVVAAAAYFAQNDIFVALAVGSATAALGLAHSCFTATRKNQAALQALLRLHASGAGVHTADKTAL